MPKHAPARGRRWQATLIITLFFVAVAGAAAIGWWYAREAPPHQGPIVLVAVDDLDPASLAAYGGTRHDMPAVDALGADAVIFDHAYAHSPLLLPAEASILSGELPYEHGVRDDAGFVLKPEIRTLAELLRGRGFDTGAAVSSFLLRRDSGIAQGFSFFDAQFQMPGRDTSPVAGRPGSTTIDAAEKWARGETGQRYFLFVQVDARDADAAVSRLTDLLKTRRLYDKATFVLMGAEGRSTTRFDETTFRVPLIIKQPASEGAGRHVAAQVRQIDLLPTLLDFVRAPVPGGLGGRSLRAAIDSGTHLDPRPVYAESLAAYYRFGGQPRYALWTDRAGVVRGAADPAASTDRDTTILREALNRIVMTHPPEAPAPVPEADEDALALSGYLQGLPPAADTGDANAPADDGTLLARHREAAVAAGHRQYTAAIRMLQALAHERPGLPSLPYQAGFLLARSGRYDEAAAALRAAMTLREDLPQIPIALARVLMRGGHLDEAAHEADAAVTLASETPRERAGAEDMAARLALARGDADAAMQHADAAHAANPALPLPQLVRGRLLFDAGEYEMAIAAFREAEAALRQNGPSLQELHLWTGEALARLDQYSEAEEELREELQQFPHDLEAYGALAMLYRASGRDDEVEDVLNELVDVAPTPEGYAIAARLWSTLGDRGRAEALRSDARTRFRGDPSLALLGRDGRR